MIGRLIIATLLTATTLAGVALQRGDARPVLLLFSKANCDPCQAIDHDYETNAAFRNELIRRYRCQPKYIAGKDDRAFCQYGVTRCPTWIVLDVTGREINRVEGYGGPEQLFSVLSYKCENGVCSPITQSRPQVEPPVQRPQEQPPARAPDADRMERLQNANSALEREVDGLRGQQQDLQRQLLDAKRQPAGDPAVAAQVAELKRQQGRLSAELAAAEAARKQAAAEADELRRRIDQPAAPPATPPAVQTPETPETPPPAAAVRSGDAADVPAASGLDDLLSRWGGTLGSVAVGAARIAAPEFVIPITAAVGAVTWWRRKKKTGRQVSPAAAIANADDIDHGLPRDNTEIEQIIGLRQQEQREPIHDAFFGVLFEDEYRANPDQPVREAWANALDRFNRTAPLSTRSQTTTSTTTKQG